MTGGSTAWRMRCSGTTLCRRVARGFTLIELIVTIAIAAVLLGLAAPAFQEVSLSSRLSDNANRLLSSLAMGRSEAIKRNATTTVCVSTDQSTCSTTGSWEQGWVVLNGSTVLHAEQAAPSGYRIIESTSLRTLSFQPSGVGATQAVFNVCRLTPTVGTQGREVSLSATGRSAVKKTTGACS